MKEEDVKKIIVAHDEAYHADDLFAVATLSILLGPNNVEIIRTRDPQVTANADYVVDTGHLYEPALNRFDHHQEGGAGARENGVPYAAFGLVWKTYGEKVGGSKEVADIVDKKLVQPLDAHDNGVDVAKPLIPGVGQYIIQDIFSTFDPTWKETTTRDEVFMELLPFVRKLLLREITIAKDALEAQALVEQAYKESTDKRLLILDRKYPFGAFLDTHPEILFVVYPNLTQWRAKGVQADAGSYALKKSFPKEWGGKRDAEFASITHVPDAVFCHNKLFTVGARSREGVIALVKLALDAK